MSGKIFLLPEEDTLVAERVNDESSALRAPVPRAQYVARIVEAVPDDWSDISGMLDATDPKAIWDTGYEFHRHGEGVRIARRRKWSSCQIDEVTEVSRPDPVALLIERRSPGFISFDDTGHDSNWEFLAARSLAVGFIRQGYRGWLSINNGRGRECAHQKPVWIDFYLNPWQLLGRAMQPAVVLTWNEEHGGGLLQLEPIHAICRRALREWNPDSDGATQHADVQNIHTPPTNPE